MSIEHKIDEKDKQRDWFPNAYLILIGFTGMYFFGGNCIDEAIEIGIKINEANQSFSEFYQSNENVFTKAYWNPLLYGISILNTYAGIFHTFYEHKPSEENE